MIKDKDELEKIFSEQITLQKMCIQWLYRRAKYYRAINRIDRAVQSEIEAERLQFPDPYPEVKIFYRKVG